MKMIYLYMVLFFVISFLMILILNFKEIHPLMVGIVMLMLSISISLIMNLHNKSSVYSMIMYLIVVGGFMIMFLYFNSIAINNKMIYSMNYLISLLYKLVMMLLIILMLIINDFFISMLFYLNSNFNEMLNYLQSWLDNDLNTMFLKFYYLILYGMIYLFYVLVVIVKMIMTNNLKCMRQLL